MCRWRKSRNMFNCNCKYKITQCVELRNTNHLISFIIRIRHVQQFSNSWNYRLSIRWFECFLFSLGLISLSSEKTDFSKFDVSGIFIREPQNFVLLLNYRDLVVYPPLANFKSKRPFHVRLGEIRHVNLALDHFTSGETIWSNPIVLWSLCVQWNEKNHFHSKFHQTHTNINNRLLV